MLNQTDYRSILCLNGTLPSVDFFRNTSLPIIAADGAANDLIKMGIIPALVIGDLDSLDATIAKQVLTLHRPDQDQCDFKKSLDYLSENNLLPAIIVGINGGYLDHILNNINLFLHTNNVLYAPPIMGFTLQASMQRTLLLPPNTKLSLVGFPQATISSSGLRWELERYELAFPGKTSCFNRSLESSVHLQIHSGTVLVLIYENET